MNKTFVEKSITGVERGRFFVSLTKRNGLEYQLISGTEPCWHDVMGAAIYLFSKMRITSDGMYKYEGSYNVFPNNSVDVRFVPVLSDSECGEEEKLPFTVDFDTILEHSFTMRFDTAVKVMLALAMSYGPKVLGIDKRKLEAFNKSKLGKGFVEVL